MSRQDVLDFQAYLADKYSLPDGVLPSIHQEVFGFVEGYCGTECPTETEQLAQEEIYADLTKMIWRVVTDVQMHDNAMYPQKNDEIPTVEQIEQEYQASIQGDVTILIEFAKMNMQACVENNGKVSTKATVLHVGSKEPDWPVERLVSTIEAANKQLNLKGWLLEYSRGHIVLYTQKAKQQDDEINWQNAR